MYVTKLYGAQLYDFQITSARQSIETYKWSRVDWILQLGTTYKTTKNAQGKASPKTLLVLKQLDISRSEMLLDLYLSSFE